jgi:hypothetical protein
MVDAHALNLQRLQNRVLRAIGKFEGGTAVREMHMIFKILNAYDYINKLWRKLADAIPDHLNSNVHVIEQEEAQEA